MQNLHNVLYAQSGGVTSVINASAFGVIRAALSHKSVKSVYVARNGIQGVLDENLLDLSVEDSTEIEKIAYTPGAIFGSCRTKIKEKQQLDRIFEVFAAHDIGYFFYNGGNDSMHTIFQVSKHARETGYPLKAIGIPKTVDNDLLGTDHCPGFGSAAKFTALGMLEAIRDLRSMYISSTRVFILESMGRHAGWLAASGALASINGEQGPDIILFPEVRFDPEKFSHRLEDILSQQGFCSIVAAEGLKDKTGEVLSASSELDLFGNLKLGKVGLTIEKLVKKNFNLGIHVSLPDYLQRSSRHISSFTDWQEAIEVGAMGVHYALEEGKTGVMVSIQRIMDRPYLKTYVAKPLDGIAAAVRYVPDEYLSPDGFYVSDKFFSYARPLMEGEAPNLFLNGIPQHARLHFVEVPKRCSQES